jgi:acetoin:2,6-dichlorophenolindophenol oxidoreductase subunit beta
MEYTYASAIGAAISEQMRVDNSVVFIGLDICEYGGMYGVSRGMIEEFGSERIINMPISEQGYTGMAIGAAITGMRPIVELQLGDWITLASDQLVNQAALMRYMFGGQLSVPMVVRIPCGAYMNAAAQHSHMFESWFAFVPGLKVIAPSTPYDAKGLMKAAIKDNNPVLVFEHRKCYPITGDIPEQDYVLPIGKADVKRVGTDVTIVTYSYMTHLAIEAAEILQNENINVEIVDLMSIRPLDIETVINSVKKTKKAICLQETWLTCSVASELSAVISEQCFGILEKPVIRIGSLDCPIPFARELENFVLPSVDKIVQSVKSLME